MGPGGVSWGSVLRALFSPRPLHARSRPGSAVDVRFSLSTTSHVPPGLHRHYSALRQEPAKVSGEQWAECGGVSPGIWGQFCRVPGSSFTDGWHGVQILSLPSPESVTAAALGLGPLSAATAVCPSPQPPGGRGGGWRVASRPRDPPEACARVSGCAGVWSGRGIQGQDRIGKLCGTKAVVCGGEEGGMAG